MRGYRKVIIFAVCLASGMVTSQYMELEHYKAFINMVIWLGIGFFTGNGAVDIFNTMRKKPDDGNSNKSPL